MTKKIEYKQETPPSIKMKLDALADAQAHRDVILLEKQRVIESIYTPEIRQAIADIDEEFDDKTETVRNIIDTLTGEVKQMVGSLGFTCEGTILQAVFVSGRRTWETDKLEKLADEHPEYGLQVYRKQGDPSVSIKVRK